MFPSDIKEAWIDRVLLEDEEATTGEVSNAFAPAAFQDYKNADKLSAPSYTDETSGIELLDANGRDMNYALNRTVEYEVRVSDFDNSTNEVYHLSKTKKKKRRFKARNASLITQLAKNGIARSSVFIERKKS